MVGVMAKTGKPSVPGWLLNGIFLLIGLGLLGGAVFSFVTTSKFIGKAVSADGVVVGLEERWDSDDNDYTYYPQVEFETEDHRTIAFTSDTGSRPAGFDVGEPVRVLFDPARPEAARIDSFFQLWLLPLVLGGMGTVFSAFGLLSIVSAMRESARRDGAFAAVLPVTSTRPAALPAERPSPVLATRHESVIERNRRD